MSENQGFENDIFISYAHIDNEALAEGDQGWISNFHRALEVRLRQLLGGEARIWRDAKLQGNDNFSDALVDKLPGVALLVSVLSPRYVHSEWCQREVDEFVASAQHNLGVQLGEKARVFKVVKTHVGLDEQPELLQKLLGYEFFQVDSASGRPREFRQTVGEHKDPRYWDKLEDLAYDVANLLKRIKQEESATPAPAPDSSGKKAIYLAPTTSDLKAEYDAVRREFLQRGHPVLPDHPLPTNGPDLEAEVRGCLERCEVSVHLIGAHYGLIPEAAQRSVVDLQNALAAERSEGGGLARVIWLPPGLEPEEERQAEFVNAVQTDPEAHRGAELLQTELGELKLCIQSLLEDSPREVPEPGDDEPKTVYVVYRSEDFDAAAKLEDWLYDQGFEVISPLFDGDDAEAEEDHRESLLECDAVLVYYGEAQERWFRKAFREIGDIVEQRDRPLAARAVVLGPPDGRPKQRFRTREALVLKCPDEVRPEILEPFVAALRAGAGGV